MADTIDRGEAARLPAGERQRIIKNLIISHDRLAEAHAAFTRFHRPVNDGVADAGALSIIAGDSRTGKSFAATAYAKGYPSKIGDGGMIYPVLVVETPATGGMRPILENLANGLGMIHSQRMNNTLLANLILDGLRAHQVELLIIDEFQDVCSSSNARLATDVKRFLRKILNLESLNIVCVGLPETYDILANDRQLIGRGGLQHAFLHPYSWDSDEERMSFRLLCDMFDEGMPFREKSRLAAPTTAERLHWVSDGIIGRLKGFLFSAGCQAINDGSKSIDYQHLADAYEWIKPPSASFNPFRDDWSLRPRSKSSSAIPPTSDSFSKKSRSHV